MAVTAGVFGGVRVWLCSPSSPKKRRGWQSTVGYPTMVPALIVKVGINARTRAKLSVVARNEPNAAYVRIVFMSKLHRDVGDEAGVLISSAEFIDTPVAVQGVNTVLANRLCKSA
jgi:hypothetical protein